MRAEDGLASDRAVDPRSLRFEGDVMHVQLSCSVRLIPSVKGDRVAVVRSYGQRVVAGADKVSGRFK